MQKRDAGCRRRRLVTAERKTSLGGITAFLAPETGQGRAIRGFAQLLESALPDLSDPLAGDAHQGADFLQRHCVRALLETVVQVKNLALAGSQVLSEHSVDELSHQVEVSDILDLAT